MSHQTQQSQQEWDEAIEKIIQQISEQKNICTVEQAIQSLILTGGQYAAPSVHAMYLQKVPESDGFTRKDVSTYLAELGDDNELLNTYYQLVHFGGLSIEDSLRLFHTELRLEALMNKNLLNTLLNGLAKAFKTNGGNFSGDIEDCIRIYNAMIMLNDSLHNKNALGRSRQTQQHFLQIINDRKANKVKEFDEDEMRRIYNSVQQCSLLEKKSMHSMQRSQPMTPTTPTTAERQQLTQSNQPKSYSKYGSPRKGGQHSDIIPDLNDGKNGNQSAYDDEPPSNGGACCIIL